MGRGVFLQSGGLRMPFLRNFVLCECPESDFECLELMSQEIFSVIKLY